MFEPETAFHDAAKFLAATPALADANTNLPKGSFLLMITLRGAELQAGLPTELTVHTGYNKQPETFVLRAKVPPAN